MKAWLKGGMWGLLIGIIIIIIEYAFFLETSPLKFFSLSKQEIFYFLYGLLILPVPTLIITFIIGSILGFIIGKIKHSKN
ncbi:MAG: hypothetical protein Q7S27_03920 [Nanoarchaeota archaeon]|nr:hypothetical protein [Nanoarchaeota archaeon]